jgi:malate dehydrogenase (quinone)
MTKTDVVIIGAGIMSATLGAPLRLVEPDWSITASRDWTASRPRAATRGTNACTGHFALRELNYTPQLPDGSIDITRVTRVLNLQTTQEVA